VYHFSEGVTVRGKHVQWHHAPLYADDPLQAWQGLLKNRGLQESDAFFSPQLSQLPNPLLMQDMEKAVQRVVGAILEKQPIHIFGDFDCDGVSGTAILVEALLAAGAQVTSSIPHRSDDGHGIGVEPVKEAVAAGVQLGISVDTGTTCFAACEEAKHLGLDLIITDHHLPDATLPPAFALLNPAREDCGFADRKLCGTGVAFFLLMGIWQRLGQLNQRPSYDLRILLDRVAVATVADVMDLVGVNRILVAHGLQRLNQYPCVGMAALMKVARVRGKVSAETIGFYIAPRINAAGRMKHGDVAMRLLLAQHQEEADTLAKQLDETNKHRRKIEMQVFKQASDMMGDIDDSSVLAVYHQDWHAGVVGLAAGRLARQYHRPAAVGFVDGQGRIRVSLRGVPGFHIGDLLHACGNYLVGFGGHAGAGGGTIREGAWDDFVQVMGETIVQQSKGEVKGSMQTIDGVLSLSAMHIGLAHRVRQFEPIGRANPAVVWLVPDVHVLERHDLKGGVIRLTLSDGQYHVPAIVFGGGALSSQLQEGRQVSLLGQLKPDDWRGYDAIQFEVMDVVLS